MIARRDLRRLAKARLEDAEALYAAGRYDGALYVCGYCVELALKAKICRTLGWEGFPSNNNEFQNYASFRTHDLTVLLRLSGTRGQATTASFTEHWSTISKWSPNARYYVIGTATGQSAAKMLEAAKQLMSAI